MHNKRDNPEVLRLQRKERHCPGLSCSHHGNWDVTPNKSSKPIKFLPLNGNAGHSWEGRQATQRCTSQHHVDQKTYEVTGQLQGKMKYYKN